MGTSLSADLALKYPFTGIAACCARAMKGRAATALLRSAMNSRRLITAPEAQDRASYRPTPAHRKGVATHLIQPSDVRFGSKADICSAQADVRYVPIAGTLAELQQSDPAGKRRQISRKIIRRAAPVTRPPAESNFYYCWCDFIASSIFAFTASRLKLASFCIGGNSMAVRARFATCCWTNTNGILAPRPSRQTHSGDYHNPSFPEWKSGTLVGGGARFKTVMRFVGHLNRGHTVLPCKNRKNRNFLHGSRVLSAGAPEEIRTPDPQIRSLVLYPAELRALDAARRRSRPRGPRHSYSLRPSLARVAASCRGSARPSARAAILRRGCGRQAWPH